MSNTEYHKGKLKKCFDEEMSFEDGINILKKQYPLKEYDFNIEDKYIDSDILHYINNTWYKVTDHKCFEPDYIDEFEINSDGEIEFMVGFYNGGTCLSEMLEQGMDRVIKKQTKGE